ncbi:hypothetical protein [Streptomyces albiflavescens]|uniref:hypothetical protein n=1 Tax=Streptomyces albiflavescens TaxID=1623582 RepID=UPI00166D0E83|nr:hypothetical protein [Streptomyces albiflavescens]
MPESWSALDRLEAGGFADSRTGLLTNPRLEALKELLAAEAQRNGVTLDAALREAWRPDALVQHGDRVMLTEAKRYRGADGSQPHEPAGTQPSDGGGCRARRPHKRR